ncbi:hypothetical protein VE03_07422 [Pseudogymnoascus sp. 23342-1-I1]|nr:hypothetical protein VE03_07422 [Pseudogymnoascus sp. 23342-1-I1]
MAGQTAGKTPEAPSRVIASRKGRSGLEKARRELEDNYRKLKANLAEVNVEGANKEDVQRAAVDLTRLENRRRRHKELEDNYRKLEANLEEADVEGATKEGVQRAEVDLIMASKKLEAHAATLNAGLFVP